MNNTSAQRIVYGTHAVTELLQNRPESIDHLYLDKDRKSEALFEVLKLARKLRLAYQMVPCVRVNQVAQTDKHQGVVAECGVKEFGTIDELQSAVAATSMPLILLPASVEDPRNLGALMRSCVAFNVTAMLLERKNTAPLSDVVSKASAGMVEKLLIIKPRNLEGVVADLREGGFAVVGAEAGDYPTPAKINFAKPTILITGGEDRGIPPYLAKQCTQRVSIPMNKDAQSLNVSVAGAVLMYEAMRQRMG